MNSNLRRAHARKLREQGLSSEDIGERLGVAPNNADQLSSQTPLPVSCVRCDTPLDYYSAYEIGGKDFCRSCRRELFTNTIAASAEFPDLFIREEP